MRVVALLLYWPIAALTAVAWVACEAMLQAHDWALTRKSKP